MVSDAVNLQRAVLDLAFRIDVLMVMAPCQLTIKNLDATEFKNTGPLFRLKARCLCIEHHLSHVPAAFSMI